LTKPKVNDELVHSEEAQRWRAQTVQLLYTGFQGTHNKQLSAELSGVLQDATGAYQTMLSKRFIDGPARVLLRQPESYNESRENSLQDEIETSLLFASRLWSQKSEPRMHGYEDYEGLKFEHGNSSMLLHVSQNAADLHQNDDEDDEDEEDNSLFDGLQVRILVQPAIFAYGNEYGEGYSSWTRVWSPGVVWLEGTREMHVKKRREAKLHKEQRLQREKEESEQAMRDTMRFHLHDHGHWHCF
jgi:hypothetical protein